MAGSNEAGFATLFLRDRPAAAGDASILDSRLRDIIGRSDARVARTRVRSGCT